MTREDMLERAASLVHVLRERAGQAESLRRMPDETIADLVAAGLTRAAQPARFGGSELGWDVLCEAAMTLGRGDASQAWVATVYAEHAFMVALFPDEAQRDVWEFNPQALISASISPVGNRVEVVDGGYVLDGRWPFASGAHHSDWTLIGDRVQRGRAPPKHLFFLVPKADRKILDDWHTAGMVGTGSATVELENVFVRTYRTLNMDEVAAGKAPGAKLNTNPLYRMPVFGFTNLALASVVVGAAEAMIEEFTGFVAQRAARTPPPLALEALYTRLAEAAAETKSAKLLIMDAAASNMRKLASGALLDAAEGTRGMHQNAYACALTRRAAARLFEGAGAHGVYLSSFIQRAFRDIYAGTVHAGLNWDRAALNYGQLAVRDHPPDG
jgi:alkylation response protein AidB-like acyl-CoA dehydrogenase